MFSDQDYAPTIYTKPLSENFTSEGYRLLRLLDKLNFPLYEWQRTLLVHILETYPPDWPDEAKRGRLRFRQVVVSVARRNGKSQLAAALSLFYLLWLEPGMEVYGLAQRKENADIVFKRVYDAIKTSESLSKRVKPTQTRGLRMRTGTGSYTMQPSKADALNGLGGSFIIDEVHCVPEGVWAQAVAGIRSHTNAQVLGITTAGDEESTLLKRLYEKGMEAVDGDDERFGFFLWQAPEGSTIEDDDAILAANPTIAEGHIDLETARNDVRDEPDVDIQRFLLNLWVASINAWIDLGRWNRCQGPGIPEDYDGPIVFGMDRAPEYEYGSIVACANIDGILHTEMVASVTSNYCRDEWFVNKAHELARGRRAIFALDNRMMNDVVKKLKDYGYETYGLVLQEKNAACETAFTKITRREVVIKNEPVLKAQAPRGQRKNFQDGWRIVRGETASEIDALLATVWALYVAEVKVDLDRRIVL